MDVRHSSRICDAKAVSRSINLIKEISRRHALVADLMNVYSALRNEKRLEMLILMLDNQICVNDLAYVLKTPQPTVSRNLLILENAGILEKRREGKWIYYKVKDCPLTRAFRSVVGGYLKLSTIVQRE